MPKNKQVQTLPSFNNIGQFIVTQSDLPVSCPLPSQALWNAHPRVYLPIVKTGEATCPYCGAHFILDSLDRPLDKS
jgi:uncharacterized Zn-finger protein